MASAKISTVAALVTGTTLLLQLLILYRTQCQIDVTSLQERYRYRNELVTDVTTSNRTALLEKAAYHGTSIMDGFPEARRSKKRRLTIAIPTVQRQDGSYFLEMFEIMLNKTTTEQLKEIVFVILLAENNNVTWKQEMTEHLNRKYHKLVESETLIVIEAPLSVYATMPDYKNNSYMLWRTKQNFDYAFIMKYSQYLSEYYMQMEDDVITSDGYYSAIMNYMRDLKYDSWTCMEFSTLGFIGKLYHSRDISHLADMLLMFNSTQPVDYTFIYFNILSGQSYKLMRKPTLFQHMGVQSSLANKVQLLRDPLFDFPDKVIKGDNPTATVFTSLALQEEFPAELAYSEHAGFFWSRSGAVINDTFTVLFEAQHVFTRIAIVTGSRDYPRDMAYNAVVEASPRLKPTKEDCSDYTPIGEFKDGFANITEDILSVKMPFKVSCLRIRFTKPQDNWVIVREIAVFRPHH